MGRKGLNNPRQLRRKTCGCAACIAEYPPAKYGERKPRRDCTGSWQARYRDPAGRQLSETFPTKKAAEAFLDKVRSEVRDRTYRDPKRGEILLTAWWDLWWPSQGGAPATRNRKLSSWTAHIKPRWGTTPLNALEYMAMQSWLTADVKGHETQRKVRELLRMLLTDAVRDGRLPYNPAAELQITARAVPKHPEDLRPPTPQQYALVRQELHPWYRPLVDFAEDTGMRPQEYVALRLCNVDRDAGIAYVREVVIDDKGTLRRQRIPKTSSALRAVPLTPKALAAVDVMIERLAPAATRSAVEDGMCPQELIFRGPLAGELRRQKDGTQQTLDSVLNRNNLHRVWLPAIKAAGIARQVVNPETGRTEWWPRLYDYRHGVASRLHAANLPEAVVQAFLGQERGSRVTWLYTHTTDEELGTARDALAEGRLLRAVPDANGFHTDSTRTARHASDALGATGTEGPSVL